MKATRAQIATIHIAKKDRGLDDVTYRDVLERATGVRSAADLDEPAARKVILAFEQLGFEKPLKPRRPASDRRPIVRKAQAMWIALHNLDEVPNGSDRALDAFAQRLTGKASLRFSTNGEVGKVVEALKSWTERLGVSTDTTNAWLTRCAAWSACRPNGSGRPTRRSRGPAPSPRATSCNRASCRRWPTNSAPSCAA